MQCRGRTFGMRRGTAGVYRIVAVLSRGFEEAEGTDDTQRKEQASQKTAMMGYSNRSE